MTDNHDSMTHSELVAAIREALGKDPRVVLWTNPVGEAKTSRGAHVTYGLAKGSSDLIGILRPSGRFVALEVKTGAAVATKDQRLFLALVRGAGGVAAIVRSVDDALLAIAGA